MGLKVCDFVSTFSVEYGISNFVVKIQRGHKVKGIMAPQICIDADYVYANLLVAYYYYNPDTAMLVIFI